MIPGPDCFVKERCLITLKRSNLPNIHVAENTARVDLTTVFC